MTRHILIERTLPLLSSPRKTKEVGGRLLRHKQGRKAIYTLSKQALIATNSIQSYCKTGTWWRYTSYYRDLEKGVQTGYQRNGGRNRPIAVLCETREDGSWGYVLVLLLYECSETDTVLCILEDRFLHPICRASNLLAGFLMFLYYLNCFFPGKSNRS